MAEADPEHSGNIGLYIDRSLKECKRIDAEIAEAMKAVDDARAEVAQAFLEYKRIEIAQARRDAEALAELQRLER